MVRGRTAASALSWTVNQDISVGKGATIEEFVAITGSANTSLM
jgi:hypothetical protein